MAPLGLGSLWINVMRINGPAASTNQLDSNQEPSQLQRAFDQFSNQIKSLTEQKAPVESLSDLNRTQFIEALRKLSALSAAGRSGLIVAQQAVKTYTSQTTFQSKHSVAVG